VALEQRDPLAALIKKRFEEYARAATDRDGTAAAGAKP
jgi:hypothetical protein